MGAKFFVPKVEASAQEEAFGEIAAFLGVAKPDAKHRVHSIVWNHDGVRWTATVGDQLRGVATIVKGRGRDKRYLEVPRYTSDTVLAIFQGAPFMIAHDNHSRYWNLPIYANPTSVVLFDAE